MTKKQAKKVSRQQVYQIKHIEDGLCQACSEPRTRGVFCEKHAVANYKRSQSRRKAANPNYKPHLSKAAWNAVDWSLPIKKIAKKLNQKLGTVLMQKKKRFTLVKTWVAKEGTKV